MNANIASISSRKEGDHEGDVHRSTRWPRTSGSLLDRVELDIFRLVFDDGCAVPWLHLTLPVNTRGGRGVGRTEDVKSMQTQESIAVVDKCRICLEVGGGLVLLYPA